MGNLSGGLGQPVDASGAVKVNQGQLDSSNDTVSTESTRATFRATGSFTPDATTSTNDIFGIVGSGTKIVHIRQIKCLLRATSNSWVEVTLTKRSAANSGGVAVTSTNPMAVRSTDAAPTATVAYYTTKPTGGAVVGYLDVCHIPVPSVTIVAGQVDATKVWDFGVNEQEPSLQNTSEGVYLTIVGAIPAGCVCDFEIEWEEAAA